MFPTLYSIAANMEASVADVWGSPHGPPQWNVLFNRDFHDWELPTVLDFFSLIYATGNTTAQEDKLQWRINGSKKYTVRAYYKILISQADAHFPWKSIWSSRVPSKVAFFVWTSALGKILTTDNLRKRGCVVMNWCYLCKKDGESVDHLLLHCEVTKVLWDEIFRRVDVAWAMPLRVVDLLCIMWYIWSERNERCFEDRELTMVEL
ncbi:hypothetical protein F2P56_014761 [Juglans regia]|uniref:Reverse transcriptase zinc-binding domain-containing protein n=1 Tax=Juglans regia TaxID=51240 RepID=A0A834CUL3_JUGRE|nr:hypothetical protein F2P56_014761 [Juglans regia]